MESITKTKLTKQELQRLVLENFSCNMRDYTELNEGHMNSIYRITLDSNKAPHDEVILKVSYFPNKEVLIYEREIMRAEVQVYQLLSSKGLPIPKILKYDFSHNTIDADYFFMTPVIGMSWESLKDEISPDAKETLMKELGKYQAIIHSVSNDSFGYYKDGTCAFTTWADAFMSMMQNIVNDGKARAIELPYDEIMDAVSKRVDLLNEVSEPQLVDFDLWAGNVLLDKKDDDWYISGIIDFERAFFGDPFADFIASVNIYTDISQEAQFIEGYRSICESFKVTEHDKERMTLYRLYMNVILAVETYRYDANYGKMIQMYCGRVITGLLSELL